MLVSDQIRAAAALYPEKSQSTQLIGDQVDSIRK